MVSTRMSTVRRSALAAAAVATSAGLVALSAGPAQAAASTTVGPAGHSYTASLVAGTTATFLVGTTTVTCNRSSNDGTVPAEPDNSAAGAVVSTLTPALFSNNGGNCPTNVLFTTAKTVSNSTNGPWTIGLQYDEAGSVGTMTIPQAGVVTTISGLASCVVTVAPDGPVSFSGPWTNGSGTTPSTLDFSAGVSLPIKVTGGLACPTGATAATFKARYAVADTTDATQQITVSAGPVAEPTPTEPTPTEPTPTEPTE